MGFGPALQGEFPSGTANLVKSLQPGGHTALEGQELLHVFAPWIRSFHLLCLVQVFVLFFSPL